jgi:hypothetical protein
VPRNIHVRYRFHRYNSMRRNWRLWFSTGRPGVIPVHHGQRPTHVHTTWPARYKVTCNGTAFTGLTGKTEVHVCQWACIRHVLTLAGRHLSRMGYCQSISRQKNQKAYCSWFVLREHWASVRWLDWTLWNHANITVGLSIQEVFRLQSITVGTTAKYYCWYHCRVLLLVQPVTTLTISNSDLLDAAQTAHHSVWCAVYIEFCLHSLFNVFIIYSTPALSTRTVVLIPIRHSKSCFTRGQMSHRSVGLCQRTARSKVCIHRWICAANVRYKSAE